MNLINNLDALTQTHFDSGALQGLVSVVHRLPEAGLHSLTILQADKPIQSTTLAVQGLPPQASAPSPQASAPSPQANAQLHVNLSAIASASDMAVAAAGYAVFHALAGGLGYAALLHAPGATDKPPIFDTRQLGHEDIFATTLFRPGRYTLMNVLNKVQGQIRVSYPVVGSTPYVPSAPVQVQLDSNGFTPHDVQLMPAQGIVIHIVNTQARITIDLAEADDGPNVKPAPATTPTGRNLPGFRWVKPVPPDSSG